MLADNRTGRPVDIVVPDHNAAAHVSRCVRSVLERIEGDCRLVPIDEASFEFARGEDAGPLRRMPSRKVIDAVTIGLR